MKHNDILEYCYDVIAQHFAEQSTTKDFERSVARYGVASYIRDNVKHYNSLQKMIIKLFRI